MYATDAMMAKDSGSHSMLGAGLSQTAQRQPEVRGEIDRLEKAVEVLGMTADTLAARLDPVRSQTGNAVSGKDPSAPEPVLCGVAGAIRSQRQRIEAAQNLLARAINELEI